MVTLFISRVEIAYALVLFGLLGLYALSKYMLALDRELSEKIRRMTDAELIDHFQALSKDLRKKTTYRKGQELAYCRGEMEKRHLL